MEAGLALGADRLECDIQPSLDGDLVLVHDDRIAIPGGASVEVANLSTSRLRTLLDGLLTLDELVELAAGRAPLMLDVKGTCYDRDLIAAIRRHGLAAESSVSTTSALTIRRLRRAFPTMRLGLSTGHWATGAPTRFGRLLVAGGLRVLLPAPLDRALALAGATEVMLHHALATPRLVSGVQAGGRQVNLWTTDWPRDIRRALAFGVDGIITNRPDVVREIVATEGW